MAIIFVSHTHTDKPVADALANLIERLFGNAVQVNYSSSKKLETSITPGADWFQWIVEQVRVADVAFVLLTPSSLQKPWVIWEAGAVAGAAAATAKDGESKDAKKAAPRVLPILFGVRTSDLPDFFSRTEVVDGTNEDGIGKLTDDLFARFSGTFSPIENKRFGAAQETAIKTYVASIREILLKLPHAVTEAAIQEWVERLDDISDGKRYSEAAILENWIDAAFGREDEADKRPLDVRIHRRLGDLYVAAKSPWGAARQFELARRLAPRDIFILRRLGKAYLDRENPAAAKAIVDVIITLDPDATAKNVEIAALTARAYEQTNDLAGARDVLQKAFDKNPDSYYLGDLLGQVYLGLRDFERARETCQRVGAILLGLREENIWTHATALSVALVCGDDAAVTREVRSIRDAKPTRGDLDSIERGVEKIATHLGRGKEVLDDLRGIDRERRAAE